MALLSSRKRENMQTLKMSRIKVAQPMPKFIYVYCTSLCSKDEGCSLLSFEGSCASTKTNYAAKNCSGISRGHRVSGRVHGRCFDAGAPRLNWPPLYRQCRHP